MSAEPHSYVIPVEDLGEKGKVYHVHSPFTPPTSQETSAAQVTPVYTSGGGSFGSALESGDRKQRFVSYDTPLGYSPGMTTCASCQQQVMTNVTYKAGTFTWLMCFLGLAMCLLPGLVGLFFIKHFKDVYHTCPYCQRVLHIEKKKCCKCRS